MAVQEVITQQKPYQAPFLDFGFERAKQLYQEGAPAIFPNSRVTPFNQAQTSALTALQNFTPQSVAPMQQVGQIFAGQAPLAALAAQNVTGMAAPQAQMMTQAQLDAFNPFIQSQVDAATNQAMRSYNERFMPQLNAAAARTGNLDSSRAGIAQGVAQRGIAENAQNIAAGLQQNLFNQGNQLNLANAKLMLDAANQRLRGSQLLGNMAGQGVGLQAQADELTRSGFANQFAAGETQQTQEQRVLADQIARFNEAETQDMRFLNDYLSLVQGNYGMTGTQSQYTEDPSLLRQGLGLAAQLGSSALMGGLNPFAGTGSFLRGLFRS